MAVAHQLFYSPIILRAFSYLFLFDGLIFPSGHLFGKGLFALFLDVVDAGGTVGLEQKGENLSYPVGVHFAGLHIAGTLGAGIEPVCQTARADFAPARFVVLLASGTFPGQELAASSAVKTASGNVPRIGCYRFHHR